MSPSGDIPTSTNGNVKPAAAELQNSDHPFNKIWRGNKQGTVRLDGIPKFDDPYAEREWVKVSVLSRPGRVEYSSY
jgi:hypothetical protein